ncbi:MAG: CAP domain-containing protein [Sporocytophaga sp.]|uniref:CAP domain-containing protein n=1 Tax=Sporocytophaga sp. TaxID=2231183 RepID=UPI001B221A9E|nr:CAP domain-containing protein [Sporocytophaga sp.]MBO9698814.1 CAP domain-containing protein [Sporocytophaga sp.]
MKKLSVWFLFIVFSLFSFRNSGWTDEELAMANTAKDVSYLTQVEKDIFLSLNLARLYPAKFADYEVEHYTPPAKYGDYLKNSPYVKSLLKDLRKMDPLPPVYADEDMYKEALCLAKEQAKSGKMGHERKRCEITYQGECCSYGMDTGRDIVMQLLIDEKIKSLGHRKICLGNFSKMGTASGSHPKTGTCAVLDFH